MKYKDAVAQLSELDHCGLAEIETLYKVEMLKRVELRAHDSRLVTKSLMESVLKEMDDWIEKVCRGLGWSDQAVEKSRQECRDTATAAMNFAIRVERKRGKKN